MGGSSSLMIQELTGLYENVQALDGVDLVPSRARSTLGGRGRDVDQRSRKRSTLVVCREIG